jgi:hypothetical protein
MHKLAPLLGAALTVSAATAAGAGSLGRPCTGAPQSQWLALNALQSKVEALGYKVQKAKLKSGCGEIYALDKNGTRAELFVDPTTGEISGQL